MKEKHMQSLDSGSSNKVSLDDAKIEFRAFVLRHCAGGISEDSFHDCIISTIARLKDTEFENEESRRELMEYLGEETVDNFFIGDALLFLDRMSALDNKIKYLLNFDITSPNDKLNDREKLDLLSYLSGIVNFYKKEVSGFNKFYVNDKGAVKYKSPKFIDSSAFSSQYAGVISDVSRYGNHDPNFLMPRNKKDMIDDRGSKSLPTSLIKISRAGSSSIQRTSLSTISSINSCDGLNLDTKTEEMDSIAIDSFRQSNVLSKKSNQRSLGAASAVSPDDGKSGSFDRSNQVVPNPIPPFKRGCSESVIQESGNFTNRQNLLRRGESDSGILSKTANLQPFKQGYHSIMRSDSFVSISNSVISVIDDKDFLGKANDYHFKTLLKKIELYDKLKMYNQAINHCDDLDKIVLEIRKNNLTKTRQFTTDKDGINQDIRYIAANIYRAGILSNLGEVAQSKKLFEDNVTNLLLKNYTREGMEDLLLKSADFCDKNSFYDLAAKCYRLIYYSISSKYSSIFRTQEGARSYNHEYLIDCLSLSLTLSQLYKVMASTEVDDDRKNKLSNMSQKSLRDAKEYAQSGKKLKLFEDLVSFQQEESKTDSRPSFRELVDKAQYFDQKNLSEGSYNLKATSRWYDRMQQVKQENCCCASM